MMNAKLTVLKYNGRTLFEKAVVQANFRRKPKFFSENEACFLFLTKGAFHFRTPTKLLSFKEGDAMLSKCGNYFLEEEVELEQTREGVSIAAIAAYFYPDMVKSFFQTDLSIKSFQKKFDTEKLNVEPLLKSFLASIDYLIDNPALADDNLVINKIKELLLILSRTEKADSITAFVSSLFEPMEYDFKEVIVQNLYADLSLGELSHLCHCSLSTFKRKFMELYGESPAKYILSKKIEKATHLLDLRNMAVSDIAFECGFETVSSFNRAFRKQWGKSPSDYRLTRIAK